MAENTPESELGSIECFQNYTASEVFVQGLAGIVDQQDVESMIRAQKQMLQRFEKTNEMLINCNTLCVTRLKGAATEIKAHTALLTDMRKDLDNIFKRIGVLKIKFSGQYPEAFNTVLQKQVEGQVTTQDLERVAVPTSAPVEIPIEPQERRNSSSSESGHVAAGCGGGNESSPCSSDTN